MLRVEVSAASAGWVAPELNDGNGGYRVDFGTTALDSSSERDLNLVNVTTEPVVVTRIAIDDGYEFATTSPALPLTLQPGDAFTIQVTFSPEREGGVVGTLEVDGDQLKVPLRVKLSGHGVYEPAPAVPNDPAPEPTPAPDPTPIPDPAPIPEPPASPPPMTPTAPANPLGLITVAAWEARYRTADANSYTGSATDSSGVPQFCKQRIRSGNMRWSFDGWYCINGPLNMYEATGNRAYLSRVLEYAEDLIAAAVPTSQLTASHAAAVGCWGWTSTGKRSCTGSPYQSRSDAGNYKGWHAWGLPYDASIMGGEYPLYEGQVWRLILGALVAMKEDPATFSDPAYRARFDHILAFAKQNVWNKWVARGMSNMYRVNTHMTSHWAHIGLQLWLLSDSSDPRRAEYRTVSDNISYRGIPSGINSAWTGKSFRTQLVANSSDTLAYDLKWNWDDPVSSSTVTYANQVVRFVIDSYERDPQTVWTAADIAKLRRTLTSRVWTQTSAGWHVSDRVDGSGDGPGLLSWGFARLGTYDAAIQKRFESHTVGRNVEMYGVGAYNAYRLLGR